MRVNGIFSLTLRVVRIEVAIQRHSFKPSALKIATSGAGDHCFCHLPARRALSARTVGNYCPYNGH